MLKRIIASVLIPAFLLQVIGCYSINEVAGNNIPHDQGKILGVTSNNGQIISFNNDGGKYIMMDYDRIEGTDEKGNDISWPLNKINELYIDKFTPINIDPGRHQKISFALTQNNILLQYNEDGGTFDNNKKTVTGILAEGYRYEININYLKQFYQEKPGAISPDDFKSDSNSIVQCFVTNGRLLINFDENGGRYVPAKWEIQGWTINGDYIGINNENIQSMKLKEINGTATTWLTLGIIFILLGGLIALGLANFHYELR